MAKYSVYLTSGTVLTPVEVEADSSGGTTDGRLVLHKVIKGVNQQDDTVTAVAGFAAGAWKYFTYTA